MLTCSADYPKGLLRTKHAPPDRVQCLQSHDPSSDSGVAFQIVPGATAAYTAGNQMLTQTSRTFPRTAVKFDIAEVMSRKSAVFRTRRLGLTLRRVLRLESHYASRPTRTG